MVYEWFLILRNLALVKMTTYMGCWSERTPHCCYLADALSIVIEYVVKPVDSVNVSSLAHLLQYKVSYLVRSLCNVMTVDEVFKTSWVEALGKELQARNANPRLV